MQSISIDLCKAGMITAEKVKDKNGFVLVEHNVALTDSMIAILRNKNIETVSIIESNPNQEDVSLDSKTTSNTQIFKLLRNVPLFSELSPDGVNKILNKLKFTKLTPDQLLFREGDIGTSMYIILSGKIRIYNTSPKGEEKAITIFKKGDSFGELALIDGEPRSASAKALSYCELIVLDTFSFHELLQDNYFMVRAILAEFSKRIRKTNSHVHDLVFLDAKTQVVKALVTLANEHGKRIGPTMIEIDIPLTSTEIANLSGISTDVVGHVLENLMQKQFLVKVNGKYQLNLANR